MGGNGAYELYRIFDGQRETIIKGHGSPLKHGQYSSNARLSASSQ
jgi:hypothetical protein